VAAQATGGPQLTEAEVRACDGAVFQTVGDGRSRSVERPAGASGAPLPVCVARVLPVCCPCVARVLPVCCPCIVRRAWWAVGSEPCVVVWGHVHCSTDPPPSPPLPPAIVYALCLRATTTSSTASRAAVQADGPRQLRVPRHGRVPRNPKGG
jgi:hypothetical protein